MLDFKQDMFDFFVQEHNICLLQGQMQDIIDFVHKYYPDEELIEKLQQAENQYAAVVNQNKSLQKELRRYLKKQIVSPNSQHIHLFIDTKEASDND